MIEAYYIHIPFCDAICHYCDFAKILKLSRDVDHYLDALEKEFCMYQEQENLDFSQVATVYFGGGTPSSLTLEELVRLLDIFAPVIKNAKEVTFEANPESLTREKIQLLQHRGITRISMGVQSFSAYQLQKIGRKHTIEDVYQVVSDLKDIGLNNFNLDLIYALPEQTLEDVKTDLEHFMQLAPSHLSAYALIIEPQTRFGIAEEAGKLSETDEALQAEMYRYIRDTMKENGYHQYEVSNWAKDEQSASKHNMTYWSGKSYLGLGLGAHGYINQKRYGNTRSLTNYLKYVEMGRMPSVQDEVIVLEMQMEERAFLGLRLISGIDKKQFLLDFNKDIYEVFGDPIRKHIEKNHLVDTGDYIQLTEEALFVSNEVLSDFIL